MTNDPDVAEYMNDIKKWCNDPEQLDIYERSMKETIRKNNEMNEYLKITLSVSDEIWKSMMDAVGYNAATSVNWAVKKLKIIYGRTKSGDRIYVPYLKTYLDSANFEKVICECFSEFIFDEIVNSL